MDHTRNNQATMVSKMTQNNHETYILVRAEELACAILLQNKTKFDDLIKTTKHLRQVSTFEEVNITSGRCAFHQSSMVHSVYYINALLEQGVSVDFHCDYNMSTSLHLAVLKNNTKVVIYLVNQGADVHKADRLGRTPLHYAAFIGNLNIIKVLIVNGRADINQQDNERWTPLSFAIQSSAYSAEVYEYLLSKGANPFLTADTVTAIELFNLHIQPTMITQTTIMSRNNNPTAILVKQQIEDIQKILTADSRWSSVFNPERRIGRRGSCITSNPHNEIYQMSYTLSRQIETPGEEQHAVKIIESCQFPVTVCTQVSILGWPLIHKATWLCKLEILHAILQRGVPVDFPHFETCREATALHYAAQKGCIPCTEILLKFDASIDAVDSNHRTPLHYASFYNDQSFATSDTCRKKIVQFLLHEGANVNETDIMGWGPLHTALANKSTGINNILGLIEGGANVKLNTADGRRTTIITVDAGLTPPQVYSDCTSSYFSLKCLSINHALEYQIFNEWLGEEELPNLLEEFQQIKSELADTEMKQFDDLGCKIDSGSDEEEVFGDNGAGQSDDRNVIRKGSRHSSSSSSVSSVLRLQIRAVDEDIWDKVKPKSRSMDDKINEIGKKPITFRRKRTVEFDRPINCFIMKETASMLGREWKMFARTLMINEDHKIDATIDGIENRYHMEGLAEKAYQCLRTWKMYANKGATLTNLLQKFEEAGLSSIRDHLVQKVKETNWDSHQTRIQKSPSTTLLKKAKNVFKKLTPRKK